MWSIFKFFFLWFWLGVAAFFVGSFIFGVQHPIPAHGVARQRALGHPDHMVLLVPLASFLMCIPSYFLARPKSQ